MPKNIAILLDGGHVRVYAKKAGYQFDPSYIEKIGHACAIADEEILRILYYDCAPFEGSRVLPVSGTTKEFRSSDAWLHELSRKNLFAVRRGVLKFRGFVLKKIPYTPAGPLTDNDFEPSFEQKGVDMRIGLDMAIMATNKSVDRLVLATNDTDCIPAMKHVRRSGIQVVLVVFPGCKPSPELLAHCDYARPIQWPTP